MHFHTLLPQPLNIFSAERVMPSSQSLPLQMTIISAPSRAFQLAYCQSCKDSDLVLLPSILLMEVYWFKEAVQRAAPYFPFRLLRCGASTSSATRASLLVP